ncbi:MAG TPA: MBL fold metallo-hydrolase [Dehalococcoidia bacterium]|jgi:glyoxylase-like metal-dependent hydrolase (beta-lactamase superfamily II)|nr:MBL fold metallo-hydrolase [Dehalococcoidia bacterium]
MALVAKNDRIQIDRLELGPFETNSYIITCRLAGESVVIDAPAEAAKILGQLKGTEPRYILITHNHPDHLGALSELKSKLRIPVAVHPLDAKNLPSPPEILLGDGDTVSFGNVSLRVLHTPGHTPGSLCFLTDKYLISGDTIFPGGPGKTRSPADLRQIIESITDKIFVLPDDTQIYPGHGDSTVLKREKAEFAIFSSRPHDPNLCGDVLWLSS